MLVTGDRPENVDSLAEYLLRSNGHIPSDLEKVLTATVNMAISICSAEESYLFSLGSENEKLHLLAAQNLDWAGDKSLGAGSESSVANQVVKTGQPLMLNRSEEAQEFEMMPGYFVRSLLSVPLSADGRVIGVLGVNNRVSAKTFSQNDLDLLSLLASCAVAAIENVALYIRANQALARRMKESQTIQTIAQVINTTSDFEHVARLTLNQVLQITKARAGALGFSLKAQPSPLTWISRQYPLATVDNEDELLSRAGEAFLRLVRQNLPFLFSNGMPINLPFPDQISHLSVPIRRGGELAGIMYLENSPGAAFSQDDLRFLLNLVEYAAAALEKLRLSKMVSKEQQRRKLVLDSIADGVYFVDQDRRILSFSPGMERITGWQEPEVIGRGCNQVLQAQNEEALCLCDVACPLLQEMAPSESVDIHERAIVGKDGHLISVNGRVAPVLNDDGQVTGRMVVMRDISRERVLTQLHSEFISMVSHELRTPLSAIISSIDLVLETKIDAQAQKRALEILRHQSDRLAKFVEKIVQILCLETDPTRIEREPIALVPLVESIVDDFRHGADRHHFILLTPHNSSLVVNGEKELIEIVFNNLLDNAIKYSPDGGPIIIEIDDDSMKEVIIHIIDEGIGVASDQQEKVFEPFYRIDGSDAQRVYGHGLGLYLAQKAVRVQGGRIWMKSKLGCGSGFSFSLPRVTESTYIPG